MLPARPPACSKLMRGEATHVVFAGGSVTYGRGASAPNMSARLAARLRRAWAMRRRGRPGPRAPALRCRPACRAPAAVCAPAVPSVRAALRCCPPAATPHPSHAAYTAGYQDWVARRFPPAGHTWENVAQGGITSGVYAACTQQLVAANASLVVLEFSVNDIAGCARGGGSV